MVESTHIAFFQAGGATDACANPITAPIVVLDDTDNDCCIDAAEATQPFVADARTQAAVAWGSALAAAQPPEDTGGGAWAAGSSFTDQFGVATPGVAFRADGVPVSFTGACVLGQIGTGRGGIYITNGRAGVPASRDMAVVLSPLGSTKVFSWDAAAGAWTQ